MDAASRIGAIAMELLYEGRLQDDPALIRELCESLKINCRQDLLSGTGDGHIRRLINFHLKGISEIPDTLYFKYSSQLNALTDHLVRFYAPYVSRDTVVSPYYYRYRLNALDAQVEALWHGLETGGLSLPQRTLLTGYLAAMSRPDFSDRMTIHALDYFERLVAGLVPLVAEASETQVKELLIRYNFNHLGLLSLLQEELLADLEGRNPQDQSAVCRDYHARFAAIPPGNPVQYQPDWPPLRSMLLDFVREMMTALEPAGKDQALAPVVKIGLNLSVAQLACWLKLAYEGGLLLSENLSEYFRLYAAAFSSKRQPQISARSLSKEYYALDQFTAAVVRDQLQRMLRQLNQHFFPVWVVAVLTCLVY